MPASDATLLAAVLADPDDDSARAVLGDLLQERGDPRGELIATQLGLAALGPDAADEPEWPALRRRERALLARHGASWLAGLQGVGQGELRRGFLDEVRAPAARLLEHPEVIVDAPVTGLVLAVDDPDVTRHLVDSGALRRIRRLRLQGDDLNSHVVALVTSPGLPALVELGVLEGWFGRATMTALATSPRAAQLRALDLGVDRRTGMVEALGAGLPALTWLGLRGMPVAGAHAGELVDGPRLPALRGLDLGDCDLDDAGAAILAAGLPPLQTLKLRSSTLSRTGVRALAAAPALRGLRALDLGWHWTGQGGEFDLVGAFPELEHLDLSGSPDPDLGLVAAASWPKLRSLIIDARSPTFRLLGRAAWPALRALTLISAEPRDHGLGAAVATAPALRGLTRLELDGVDDDSLAALAQGSWPALHTLVLTGSEITDAGAQALADATELPSLIHLHVRAPDVAGRVRPTLSRRGLDVLRDRFGSGVSGAAPRRRPWPGEPWVGW